MWPISNKKKKRHGLYIHHTRHTDLYLRLRPQPAAHPCAERYGQFLHHHPGPCHRGQGPLQVGQDYQRLHRRARGRADGTVGQSTAWRENNQNKIRRTDYVTDDYRCRVFGRLHVALYVQHGRAPQGGPHAAALVSRIRGAARQERVHTVRSRPDHLLEERCRHCP